MYGCRNNIKRATRRGKLFLVSLLVCTAIVGNFKLAQAQTIAYTTTGSTTTTKIQIYYGPETTLDQMIGMELAANVWSQYLADDVNVKLFATTTNRLPKDVLGSATVEMLVPKTSYQTFLSKFNADRKSQNDSTASKNFQTIGDDDDSSGLSVMVKNRVISGIDYINFARANAKALGILSSTDTGFDGHIVLDKDLTNLSTDPNEPLTWSYNYTNNSIPSDSLDFLTTVIHEMGHMLGFIDGVDNPNLIKAIKDNNITDSVFEKSITPLDLYRFSNQSKDKVISGDDDDSTDIKGIPDLSIGGEPFFTFDKGKSKVEDMAKGEDSSLGGDGDQASHWLKGKKGIMEPYLQTSKREVIADTDLTALDLVGWDVRSPAMELDQLEAILPNLYNQAKATAEAKMADISTWFLTTPPELVNPISVDNSTNVEDDDDDDDDGTSVSEPPQDSSLEKFCKDPENYNTSECLLWRSSGFQEWDVYYQKITSLNQKWLLKAPTISKAKLVLEKGARA
ncbi:MAG: hypothetical protein HXY43_11020 [Fischerella sp.]|uniref:NF038122 family metalloprotease n=1 Tax=Fischerella sp. TaxID=1191 RepID=UPI0018426B9F|nr:NF038122 family metalloprotease [Fischerella sp.]NWF59797.1 hypothetical protein [Fischerella sp.]